MGKRPKLVPPAWRTSTEVLNLAIKHGDQNLTVPDLCRWVGPQQASRGLRNPTLGRKLSRQLSFKESRAELTRSSLTPLPGPQIGTSDDPPGNVPLYMLLQPGLQTAAYLALP